MELCRRNVEDGIPYTFGDDMLLAGIAREAMLMCWRVIDDDLWQTVGAGVARDGERTARVFRDMAVAAAHRNLQLRDMFYGDIGRAALGEPQRILGAEVCWAAAAASRRPIGDASPRRGQSVPGGVARHP